ncbi:LINE-1 retrotransposable element ORF1 protein [Holothuria leucospilota]|uniref:LINE-1 retrotransposable element ORF1 protein n=1 Tax=Holothuria leucospilota TaxID=206669 RepID=A0A9Q1BPB5_HOLLE|nr:LINE-1 retrotransposable element ORF1 protein [Holothuria leucospilota]
MPTRRRPPLSQKNSARDKPSATPHRPTQREGTVSSLVEQLADDNPSWEAALDNFKKVVEESVSSLHDGINQLKVDLGQAIEFQAKRIDDLESKMADISSDHTNFHAKISRLESALEQKDEELNKLERMSRRNNFRIVGYPKLHQENVEDIVRDEIIPLFGDSNGIVVERCHRDGRGFNGRPPHILVRCLSYRMKVNIMKNRRTVLNGKDYFIVDDLTKMDLAERKKWAVQVKQLYEQGTRLRFSGGKWRDGEGKPFNFTS